MRFFIWISLTLVCAEALCQSSPPYTLPVDPINYNTFPPAPESWAFTKYGEYPVSRETGVPNISIPLYNAVEGKLSVPIGLSYHASGIKVDDMPSWVGSGWDLNVGGVVTRTVKGHPDERMEGYLNTGIPELSEIDLFAEWEYVKRIMAGEADAEPDEFSFNAPGLSGKFYFRPDGTAICHPFQDASIAYTINSNNITTITITASNGVKYTFGSPSMTSYVTNNIHLTVNANTSWYLLEMLSPTGETMNFFYKTNSEYSLPRVTQTDYVTLKTTTTNQYFGYTTERKEGYTQPTYGGVKAVERIEYKGGKIVFNSSSGRLDDLNALKLNSIEIYGADLSTIIKAFDFGYDHFVSAQPVTPSNYGYRLKLVSVGERTLNGVSVPPYSFDYHEHYSTPPRFSFGQDYWGYPNGKLNGSLLPQYTFKDPIGYTIHVGDADREPDESWMKVGTIKRIKYPTQGYTDFDFAANRVKNSYTKTTVNTPTFSEVITPTLPSITEKYKYFPAQGVALPANKTAFVSYSIQEVQGTLSAGSMSVGLEDLTTGQLLLGHATRTDFTLTQIVYLTAGHQYRLYVRSNIDQVNIKGYAQISLYWEDTTTENVTENTMVGGLRISSIKNYDDNGTLQTEKFYNYNFPDNSGFSSGNYNGEYMPSPEAFVNSRVMRYAGSDYCIHVDNVLSITASPSNTKGFPPGPLVTYQYVTELNADPANNSFGKSIYRYDIQKNPTVSQVVGSRENSWSLDKSWLRGQLRKESHLNQNGDTVKNVSYQYEVVDVYPSIIASKFYETWQIGSNHSCVECGCGGGCCFDPEIASQRYARTNTADYEVSFQWKRLKSITTTQDGLTSTTNVSYDPQNRHSNVTYAEQTTSDNKQVKTYIRYPHEVNETELLNRKITGVPLESDVYLGTALQSGNRISYSTVGAQYIPKTFEQRLADGSYLLVGEVAEADLHGNPLLIEKRDGTKQYALWNAAGNLPLAQVIASNVSISNALLDPTYSSAAPGTTTLREFIITHGQRVSVSTTIQDPSGAITGPTIYSFYIARAGETTKLYNHTQAGTKSEFVDLPPGRYHLRADLNAASSKNIVTQVTVNFKSMDAFYQGFEDSEGNSTVWDARTGAKSRTNNYQIALSNLTDGKPYTLSYYKKVNDAWTYQSSTVNSTNGIYTIDLTGQVDEIRFYPQGAQVTTFAYDPINSSLIRTVTDPNNRSLYYEYDPHGRLQVVRDNDLKITKSVEYQFKTGQN